MNFRLGVLISSSFFHISVIDYVCYLHQLAGLGAYVIVYSARWRCLEDFQCFNRDAKIVEAL